MSDRDKAFGYAVSKWGTSNTPARENLAFADGWKAALDWTSTTTPSPISDQAAGERVTEKMLNAGLMALVQCTASELEDYSPKLMEGYIADVTRVFTAMQRVSAATTTGSAPEYTATLPADWHVDSSLATWFPLTAKELESMTRMFHEACHDLGLINEALGLDPDDGGAEPILDAIAELKADRSTAPTTGSAPEINQCDGCRVNAPLTERYGNHAMPDGGFMACTKDRYAAPASPAASVLTDSDIDGLAMSHCYELIDSKLRFTQSQWRSFARALLAASMGGDRT